jgi:photosystem II stability/assembly factor-like uncharacterized protein
MTNLPRYALLIVALVALLLPSSAFHKHFVAAQSAVFFPQTGYTVQGAFLTYWEQHGGLAQQGYPLSDEIQEISPTNGKTYTVQYFERALFEKHPENSPPNDVLLSLLGVFAYQQRYGATGTPDQQVSTNNPRYFPETRHTLGGKFRTYWETHGGLAQQGYPISDEFEERSPLDGKIYRVQYFQRAVFEWHPENTGTPYEVLLSQLGTFRYQAQYGIGKPSTSPTPDTNPAIQAMTAHLYSISMTSPDEGWASGDADIQYDDGTRYSGGILRHYSGGKWNVLQAPSGRRVTSVSMISATEGWAVGPYTILHYTDNNWQELSGAMEVAGELRNVDMISPEEGWSIGMGGPKSPKILHYHEGIWENDPMTDGSFLLTNLKMISSTDGWAVGGPGIILHYTNGSWIRVTSPTDKTLWGISMLSSNDGWIVGDGGTILHYTDNQWTLVPSPVQTDLSSVYMLSAADGWAVGANTILHYNAGKWSTVPVPASVGLTAITMVSSNEGWAVDGDGAILHYYNGVWSIDSR